MAVALGGFLVRMMLVTGVVVAVKDSLGRPDGARRHHPRDPPRPAGLGDAATCRATSPTPVSSLRSPRRRDAVAPRSRLPADQPPGRVADHLRWRLARHQQGRPADVARRHRRVHVLPHRAAASRPSCPTGVQNLAEIDRRLHRATASSCRRWARTAWATRRSCSRCSPSSSSCNIWEIIPFVADAGERPHRDARCSSRCWCGSSTTSSASSTRASRLLQDHRCSRPACRSRSTSS